MFLSELLLNTINQAVTTDGDTGQQVEVLGIVSGGSINSCYRLGKGRSQYFLKLNREDQYPEMFLKEALGLKLLRQTETVDVPRVLGYGTAGVEQFLLLEWINAGPDTEKAQERLGHCLADMHQHTNPSFGLDYSNYMGSLTQTNNHHDTWSEFFIRERLIPQVKLARNDNLLTPALVSTFDTLCSRIHQLFEEERPSLLHGDLWAGNYMINTDERPVLIDPAVCYGHREFDLAMTRLFGGFDQAFYEAYQESFPLEASWEQRVDLWNLYPLLVHLNLFGGAYLSQIQKALRKYV